MELNFPVQGKFVVSRFPLKFSEMETPFEKLPPMLGEDNEQVLTEYGYSKAEIASFKDDRVI